MVLNWLFNRSKQNYKNFRDLIDSDALKIVDQLQRAGFKSYLVGGCVRDLLLSKKPKDFDIATSATPNQVKCSVVPRAFIEQRFRIVIAKRRPHGILHNPTVPSGLASFRSRKIMPLRENFRSPPSAESPKNTRTASTKTSSAVPKTTPFDAISPSMRYS